MTFSCADDVPEIVRWIDTLPDETELCVGGPRASEYPEVYDITKAVSDSLLEFMDNHQYTEEFDDKIEAQRREYVIKQMTCAEKEKLIKTR